MGNFSSCIYKGSSRYLRLSSSKSSKLHDIVTSTNFKWIDKEDYKIPTYLFTNVNAKVFIIYCHANGEVLDDQLITLYKYTWERFGIPTNAILFEYPGYGLMKGEATTKGCYTCLCDVVDYIMSINDKHLPIILHGRSIGAAFASRYASENDIIDGIILETPFSSIHSIFSGCCISLRCCCPDILCSEYLHLIKVPKLMIYGTKDPLNPQKSQDELLEYFDTEDHVLRLANFSHNNIPFGSKKSKLLCCIPHTCCCMVIPPVSGQQKKYFEIFKEYITSIISMTLTDYIDTTVNTDIVITSIIVPDCGQNKVSESLVNQEMIPQVQNDEYIEE
ncbi:hypothetical protein WA158_005675 [Blastocystis sp. Blastoise]